jgi:hypothetical protein
MSPKNSIAGTCRRSPWKPSKAIMTQVSKAKPIKKFLIILVKHRDASTADLFKKFSSRGFGEFWIRSFYCEEKGVVGNTLKGLEIEKRMMPSRLAIQHEDAKKSRESGK